MPVETVESMVLDVFRSVLKDDSVSIDADFFESGGDSLLAIDAVARITQILGQEVDPVVIFMYPTPASCAAALADLT